ncbi:MAG: translocation/assembly module TamB domain-containing protein, partial [Polaromonas sp.]
MDPSDNLWNEPAARPAKPARRWLRAAARAVGGVVLLALTALGALWWWAGTDGSLATALGWIGQSQPLRAERATGSLRAGGHIDRLAWQKEGLSIDARDLSLAWQPWSLLQGTLRLERLSAASVQINDQRAPAAAPSTGPPMALGLPLPVVLESFSVGELRLTGPTAFTASDISGRYEFNGMRHQLDLLGVQVASGRYSGRAVLPARSPLTLDATLSGDLAISLPNSQTTVPLAFRATASGPLTELLVKAELQMTAPTAADAARTARQPHASATARVTPWAAQPLPQADASFRDLNLAALWPAAPQTLLTGSASARPIDGAAAAASPGWLLQLQLANGLSGPWDQQRLPLERLDSQGEWRNGAAIVRALKAQLGGGELLASAEWTASQAWNLKATAQRINPALLHTQLAPVLLDGQATLRSQGAATGFDASVKAAGISAK